MLQTEGWELFNCFPNGRERETGLGLSVQDGEVGRNKECACLFCASSSTPTQEEGRKGLRSVGRNVLWVEGCRDPRMSDVRMKKAPVSKRFVRGGGRRSAFGIRRRFWFVRDVASQMLRSRTGRLSRKGSS